VSSSAWETYWLEGNSGHGCVPDCSALSQKRLWQAFASKLKKGSRLLDVATGDGAVLQEILRARKDLKLIGVDSSPRLPPAGGKFTLMPGVKMEKLPFSSHSFDAVCSQFGFEYSEMEVAADEVARVLKLGGHFQFLIHTRDGPILKQNLARRDALQWAATHGQFEKAAKFVQMRNLVSLAKPTKFQEVIEEAKRAYPTQPVASEIFMAILQILMDGHSQQGPIALQQLSVLRTKVMHEIARLDALDKAAMDPKGVKVLVELLSKAGLGSVQIHYVTETDMGQPLGWLMNGRRIEAGIQPRPF